MIKEVRETEKTGTEGPMDPVRKAGPAREAVREGVAPEGAVVKGPKPVKSEETGGTRGQTTREVSLSPPYWLIVRGTGRGLYRVEIFATDPDGNGKALPVFGSEEEAQTFLRSLAMSDEWRARKTGGGELLSVLSASSFSAEPCANVERIALDPSPEMVEGSELELGLVCMERRCFMERLMGRGRAWFDGTQSK